MCFLLSYESDITYTALEYNFDDMRDQWRVYHDRKVSHHVK